MIKFVALLLLFVLALSTPSAAKMLYYDLKGITAITYDAVSKQDSKSPELSVIASTPRCSSSPTNR